MNVSVFKFFFQSPVRKQTEAKQTIKTYCRQARVYANSIYILFLHTVTYFWSARDTTEETSDLILELQTFIFHFIAIAGILREKLS